MLIGEHRNRETAEYGEQRNGVTSARGNIGTIPLFPNAWGRSERGNTGRGEQRYDPALPRSTVSQLGEQRNGGTAERAYHRALGDVIHVRHPSLWSFLRVLKDRQAVAEQQLAAARRGQAPPTRRRKWRVLEANLIRL
ncbi:hypothetical protein ACOMHN_051397 [Nucella lapillus]